jgi:agmatine/peptidylarginine deiminase
MKIVINDCYGGFSLSPKAELELLKRLGYTNIQYLKNGVEVSLDDNHWNCDFYSNGELVWLTRTDDRTNPHLIDIVEEMGEEANGHCAQLKIIEIPDDVSYFIDDYDGAETVRETHRSWS